MPYDVQAIFRRSQLLTSYLTGISTTLPAVYLSAAMEDMNTEISAIGLCFHPFLVLCSTHAYGKPTASITSPIT